MLPVIVFVAVAVPLLLLAFVGIRRRMAGEEAGTADAATQEEYEREFEDAEAYQEQWREEQHKLHPDDRLY
jgi:hypothetical protein